MTQCRVIGLAAASDAHADIAHVEVTARAPDSEETTAMLLVEGVVLARRELEFQIEVCGQDDFLVRCDPWMEQAPGDSVSGADYCYRFRCEIGMVGFADRFALEVALRTPASSTPLAQVEASWDCRLPGAESTLSPLFVTSHGRSGSSFLMSLLNLHPSCVVHGAHPFECRAANYWLHALRVLTAPASFDGGARPERFHLDNTQLGQMPENSFRRTSDHPSLQITRSRLLARTADYCVGNIADFYATAAHDKEQASYLAEKSLPRHIPWIAKAVYPHFKEIILVRDLRDVACSMRAFAQKRSHTRFGGIEVSDWQAMIDSMKPGAERMLSHWNSRRGEAHLVRYEDLLAAPEDTLDALFTYLGLEDTEALGRLVEAVDQAGGGAAPGHQTTASPAASVGRWATEMPADVASRATEQFAPTLEAFGYPRHSPG